MVQSQYVWLDSKTHLTKYPFTKCGEFMYNLVMSGGLFLYKHRWLYYILELTWGLLLTLIGFMATLVVMIMGRFPKKYKGVWYQSIFKGWGGWEFGLNFLCDRDEDDYIKEHELGHTYQNCILGPFQIFLIWLPSAIRYQWQDHVTRMRKRHPETYTKKNPPYDSIWFENAATNLGKTIAWLDQQKQRTKVGTEEKE